MKMKIRLIKLNGNKLLLCSDGSIKNADKKALKELLVFFKSSEKIKGKDGKWSDEVKRMEDHPGETLAYVNSNNVLCIVENPFIELLQSIADDEYITLHEYAELHNRNDNRIKALCREGRLEGAIKKSGKWFIPKNSPYPKDARYSGIEK